MPNIENSAHVAIPTIVVGPPVDPFTKTHKAVADLTERLFGFPCEINLEQDEETDDAYFVVSVAAAGSVETLLRLNHQWHVELSQAAGELALKYCLSLYPQ